MVYLVSLQSVQRDLSNALSSVHLSGILSLGKAFEAFFFDVHIPSNIVFRIYCRHTVVQTARTALHMSRCTLRWGYHYYVPGFATHLKRINLQIAMKRWCSRWTLYLAIIYGCLMNIQGTSWCRPCSFAGSVLSFRFCTSLHLLYFLLRSLPSLSPPPTHTCTQTTPPLFPSISAHNLPANHVQTENVFTGEPENRRELVWFAWQTLSKKCYALRDASQQL